MPIMKKKIGHHAEAGVDSWPSTLSVVKLCNVGDVFAVGEN